MTSHRLALRKRFHASHALDRTFPENFDPESQPTPASVSTSALITGCPCLIVCSSERGLRTFSDVCRLGLKADLLFVEVQQSS